MLFSRREFLERSMLAATAALGTTALGVAEEKKRETTVRSPNEVLRIAILGVNGRGGEHLGELMTRNGCEVAAIVDPDETVGQTKGVERVEKTTGKRPKFYQDLRRVFDDPGIDIVTIATPNHWHSLAAIWAMQAKKDVYVEKPVSHNVSEGRRCVEAARKYDRICQTGTQCRSMNGTILAIEAVKAGKIGEVKLSRGLCYKNRPSIGEKGDFPVPAGLDYNLWLGPAQEAKITRPKFHYDWHWQWDYGNGDLGNQGIHQMDIARWGLGVDHIGDSVFSFGGRVGYVDAGETANTQVSVHTFGDKTLVFEVRGLKSGGFHGARVGVVFHGTEGYIVMTGYDTGARFDKEGKMVEPLVGGGDHFGNFIDAVRSRSQATLRADILEGHLSSALCHLGNISLRLGQESPAETVMEKILSTPNSEVGLEAYDRVGAHLHENGIDPRTTKLWVGPRLTLDGYKEVFVGERANEANPMLTREYRAPFVVPAAGQV